jgi:DNA topoisomerase I
MSDSIEKIIAKISPGMALKRARQRKALAFEAAMSGRLRGHATQNSAPNDYTEARDRLEIIKQARDLRDNFGLYAAIIRKLSIYALGRVRYRAHTGNAELNTAIDAYISGRSQSCDVSGRFSLPEMGRMVLSEVLTAGDIFCGFRKGDEGTAPQLIEADRVGGPIALPTTNDQVGGVRFDPDTGKIISYTVYDRTPAGGYVNKREIAAHQMVQIMDPERYDRYRGISPFAPVLNEMRDLKEVMAACLIGVKVAEYHAGFISGGSGVPNDPDSYFTQSSERFTTGAAMTETKLTPGIMQYLPEGTIPHFAKSERPSGQFQSYLELLIRTIANALGLPFGFVYSLSGLGGPAARMDAAQAQRVIEYWQSIIAERFFRPVVNRWILDGVASGDIASSDLKSAFSGIWQFAPSITIDVGRDSAAGINEIRAGLMTREDWWGEEGKDARQQMQVIRDEAELVIAHAKELSESTGLAIERCLDMLDMRTPNGTPPLATTPPVPEIDETAPARDEPPPEAPKPEPEKPKPDTLTRGESPEMSRLKTIMAAPHVGASPDHDDSIASALDAARRVMLYDPSQPRDDDGKWGEGGGGGATATKSKTSSIADKYGLKPATEAEKKDRKLPPAWKDVAINPDPSGDLQAVGVDAKGRIQRVYSEEFTRQNAEAKFERVNQLEGKSAEIFAATRADMGSSDAGRRENASALALIQETGIRPGSDADTGSKVKAYGATTLEGRHVVQRADGVHLEFVGKKGVNLDIPVSDPAIARDLIARKNAAGNSGKLYSATDASLRDYTKTVAPGHKPKDFRTLKGTSTARALVGNMAPAADEKSYRRQVMGVAKQVSQKLGNTPTIALQSYIAPQVFEPIKPPSMRRRSA